MATPPLEQLSPEYLSENNGSSRLMNTSIAFIVLSTVIYAAFVVSRVSLVARNGWETWTLYPLSYLLALALCVIGILIVTIGGGGRHTAVFLASDPSNIRREKDSDHNMGCSGRGGIILVFTICKPFAFKWDKTIHGECADWMASYRYVSIPNIITDIAIILLPVRMLYQLNLGRTEKLGVFVATMAGGLGIITSVIRFVGFYLADLPSDVTWYTVNTSIYTIIEVAAYFVCSCLPGIRPLVRLLYKKLDLSILTSRVTKSSNWQSPEADMPLGNPRATYKASVTSSRQLRSGGNEGFILLEETIQVGTSSTGSDPHARRQCPSEL
ncbi:uncharacterized protein F4822DRAFT_430185 [Hypoxylon trugodes]|uniref:uncharacterized protein n=1 Tax=Hypoxylon trugodes TaxID=326681 RepID=UPI0021947351|nr:uncharacterized protein F4822DRAFT_430185 [Hypoxylon trugodes]KAI1387437.1 hypothetical protein F4822DRAFT_430185 [Hypoxylon trugodes]